MTPTEVIELLQICVGEVYFVFNNKLYIQIKGLAIGYSSSVFTADIVMETIETRALQTFANPPSFWARFVDDVYSYPKTITTDHRLDVGRRARQHSPIYGCQKPHKSRWFPGSDSI